MSIKPVALILGAGPRVGLSVAEAFSSNGYKVAMASRSGRGAQNINGLLSLKADLTEPSTIPPLFEAVKTEFGSFPSVVIYNAAALTKPPEEDSTLSVPVETFTSDLNLNTVSPYVAAQQAVLGWKTLPKEFKKSFIYTGNILNTTIKPVPYMLTLGIGKSASAFWVGLADMTYTAQGFRFFYADERQADGNSVGMAVDGPAHGKFFAQLAEHEHDVPWLATFVKDKGYVKF